MTFGAPAWFLAMGLLPLFGLLFLWNERRSRALLRKVVASRLAPELAGSVSRAGRLARFLCFVLGLACVIAALARPRIGYTIEKVPTRGRDVLIAIDTSKSMLSTDLPPNRLTRAKLAAEDLIRLLPGDRTGLVAFAGEAFLEAPLTVDYGAVLDSIHELDTSTIPLGGTNLAEAIQMASQAFGKSESENNCLILFTDGEELDGSVLEAAHAVAGKFRIFTVGIGSAEGSVIPVPADNGGTDFVRDDNGEVVRSKLDEARLKQVAEITGGFYTHLQNGPADMKRIVDDGLSKLKEHDTDEKLAHRPIERYQWPLAAGLFLLCSSLLISERRRRRAPKPVATVVAAAACLLLLPHAAYSANPGIDAYQQKDFKDALRDFQQQGEQHPDSDAVQFDQGAAFYQLGDYENAIAAFGKALAAAKPELREKAEYNLANSLFQRAEPEQRPKPGRISDLKNAIQHYDEALKADPKDGDAKFNKELAEKKLTDLLKPPPSPTPTPTPSPTPSQSPTPKDQKKKDQGKKDNKSGAGKDKKNDNQKGKDDQQQQGDNQKGQDDKQQPGKDQQGKSDGQKNDQQGQNSPPPQGGQQPTPGEGRQNGGQEPSPTPDAGNEQNQQNQQNHPGKGEPSPTAQPMPSGEIKSASQPSPGQEGADAQAAQAASPKPGEMTPSQAANLLESMKDEDARYPLNEQKHPPTVLRDW